VAEFAVHIERQRVADHRGRRLFDVETADIWNGVGPCLACIAPSCIRCCSPASPTCRSGGDRPRRR
jgi:hypothetical protein